MMGLLLILAFAAAQGAAVFATAYLSLRFLKRSDWLAKAAAMAGWYLAWAGFTLGGYALIGGEGGLMDGFGLVLFLCFTALASSFVYAIVWACIPAGRAGD